MRISFAVVMCGLALLWPSLLGAQQAAPPDEQVQRLHVLARKSVLVPEDYGTVHEGLASPRPLVVQAALSAVVNTGCLALLDEVHRLALAPDAGLRHTALDVLATLRDSRSVPVLQRLLADGDADTRMEIYHALSRIDGADAARLLAEAYRASGDAQILSYLSLTTVDLSAEVLLEALEHPANTASLHTAIEWVCLWKDQRAVPRLLELLRADDARTQQLSAQALGELRVAQAVDPLIPLLNVREVGVRLAAIEALAQVGDVRAVAPVRDLLTANDPLIVEAAIRALGTLRCATAVTPFVSSTSTEIRLAAVEAIRAAGDADAAQALKALVNDPEPGVRSAAIYTIASIKSDWSLPFLGELIARGGDVRVGAIFSIGVWRLAQGKAYLLALFPAAEAEVKALAIDALSRLGPDDADVQLFTKEFETSGHADVRMAAAVALAWAGREIGPVRRFLEDIVLHGEDPMASRALMALSRYRDDAAFTLIKAKFDAPSDYPEGYLADLYDTHSQQARAFLVGLLKADVSDRVRDMAFHTVKRGQMVEAADTCLTIVRTSTVLRRRAQALDALSALANTTQIDDLLPVTHDASFYLRALAIRALAALDDPRAEAAVIAATRDPSPLVRQEAVTALRSKHDRYERLLEDWQSWEPCDTLRGASVLPPIPLPRTL